MIKVSLIVMTGLAIARLMRNRSAASRHWVLAAAVACAAVMPLLEPFVPAWHLRSTPPVASAPGVRPTSPAPDSDATRASTSGVQQRAAAFSATDVSSVVQFFRRLWLLGTAFSLVILVVGLGRLAWLASKAERLESGRWIDLLDTLSRECGVQRPVTLLQSDHPTLLMTWGLLRPKVILPSRAGDWPDERIRIVLAHELAHIRRGDWAVHMLAELFRGVYWFNPAAWWANNRLRQEGERACDDEVLSLGVDGQEYAAHLLEIARAASRHRRGMFPGLPAPAMVRRSGFERRIAAVLNTRLSRTPATRRHRVISATALLALAVLVAGFGAVAQSFSTFSGSVFDPLNTGIPQVTLVLTNLQSKAKHEVRSDDGGRFEFVGLPAGEYLLEAQYPGFAVLKGKITVGGENVQRNLALEIGSLQETISVRESASATRVAPAPSAAAPALTPRSVQDCRATSAGGNLRPPRKLADVHPQYPARSREAKVEGTVRLAGRIGVDGFLREINVVESPSPDLASAALEAVRQWQFDSTLLNCVPVEVPMKVTINFALER